MWNFIFKRFVRAELNLREVEKSRPLMIRSLSDLVSLVPLSNGNDLFSRNLTSALSDDELTTSKLLELNWATKNLVNHINSNNQTVIKTLTELLNTREEFATALFSESTKLDTLPSDGRTALEHTLARFAISSQADREILLNSDSGLGLLLFTCCCNCTPTHELRFSMHPEVRRYCNNSFIVTLSEIKIYNDLIPIGKSELQQQMSILKRALEAAYETKNIAMKGTVYLPKCERGVLYEEDLQDEPTGFDIDVKYV